MMDNKLTQERAQELWKKGNACLASGNEEEALRLFRELAESGVLQAQFNLGTMYYNGQGTAPDYQEALKWYRMAADKGLKEAQCALGDMYEYGTGVECDLQQAAEWYTKAADQGHARAFKTLVKLNSKIEQKEQGYPYYVDTPSDIMLGCIYHDFGQPIFITQKGGVGMLPSIGGCLLTGELLRDVTFEGIDAVNKRGKDVIRRVLVADQDGNYCSADILGFANMEGDVSIHKEAVSYSTFDYARLILRLFADLSGWREPLELFCENLASANKRNVKAQTEDSETQSGRERPGTSENQVKQEKKEAGPPEKEEGSSEKEDVGPLGILRQYPVLKWLILFLAVLLAVLLVSFLFT